MAVTAISGAASADTSPAQVAVAPTPKAEAKPAPADDDPVRPRLLPSGAPACGNVMFKSYAPSAEDPTCEARRMLRQVVRNWQAALAKSISLTLAPPSRPQL